MGSLKFAIGLEPPSLRNTAGVLLSLEISYDISPWKINFSWSCLLLISGCFLSVTILYHSPWDSSIRRYANDAAKDLCSFKLAAPGKKWYNKYVGRVYAKAKPPLLFPGSGGFLLCWLPLWGEAVSGPDH